MRKRTTGSRSAGFAAALLITSLGLAPRPAAAQALEYRGVTLRTVVQNLYAGTGNVNGVGGISVTATEPHPWEIFTLVDRDGGQLESGDAVLIRTAGGNYFQALNGGGSTINAATDHTLDWETFFIVRRDGPGPIFQGDVVGLQAITNRSWVSAQDGGGSWLYAYGQQLGSWESFVIDFGVKPVAPPVDPGWRLVWSDEFEGGQIDDGKWAFEVQRPYWVNNELENYTDHRWENARVENGHLVIEGRRDWFQGYEYSSARLKTQGRASWTYGRIEARIQLPSGVGTWPAFWLMPDDMHRGWPACGEFDILEHVGHHPNIIHATAHSAAYNWKSTSQRTAYATAANATGSYHVYALEWYPDLLDTFIDGEKYLTVYNENTGDDAWPFHKNFHIILNIAIGGSWGGEQGVDPNSFPHQMLVDYVRVYQR